MEKRLSFAVVLVTLTSLDANTADEIKNLKERVEVLEKNKEVGSSAPDAARPGAKNGTGLFFTAEALYWKMEQKGMTYAIKGTNNSLQNVQIDLDNGKSKKPELDWTWGSRLGAGYNLHRNGWDLFSTWFQLHASDHSKASIGQSDPQASPGQFLSPFWIAKLFPVNFPSLINTAKAHWKVDLDVLDLELGREFFIGKWLRLRPFIGARTAWINQDFNLRFFREASPTTIIYPATNNSSWHLDMDNDFWGIGARAGLNTKW